MGDSVTQSADQVRSILEVPSILPIAIAIIVLALIIGVAYYFYRQRIRPKPRPKVISKPILGENKPINTPKPPMTPPGPAPEELADARLLAEQYCDVIQKIENKKAEEVYGRFFLKYGMVFQTLIGIARRYKQQDMTDEHYWSEMDILLENSSILRQVDSSGSFRIQFNSKQIDRQAGLEACEKLSLQSLRNVVKDRLHILEGYTIKTDFKALLAKIGPVLQSIGQAYTGRDLHACVSSCSALKEILERNNCHCLFAGDPEVAANPTIQVDFRDDYPQATELPGLYTKMPDGSYVLIGDCIGTRRVYDGK